ncbi:hypothetical protein [Bacillus cereus]|uniref:hypothetical protein n=1 Tax=Bacillus cereus TaxID=1396 RepID=UPI000BF864F1|nr:hypothetical protein [Bacillus cereus]PEY14546.1 hypothetical protein CN342_24770 [Bacillus cereus]
MERLREKLFRFAESYFLEYLLLTVWILLLANEFTLFFSSNSYGLIQVHEFIYGPIKKILTDRDGTIINIAAIFLGIYFTVFTLLGSVKIQSVFASISQNNFNKIITFTKAAFGVAFIYIFFSLAGAILDATYPKVVIVKSITGICSIILLMYMLMSALRFAVYIYLIFEVDLKNLHSNIEKEREEKRKNDELFNRLETFLNEHEDTKYQEQARKMAEKLREREEHQ